MWMWAAVGIFGLNQSQVFTAKACYYSYFGSFSIKILFRIKQITSSFDVHRRCQLTTNQNNHNTEKCTINTFFECEKRTNIIKHKWTQKCRRTFGKYLISGSRFSPLLQAFHFFAFQKSFNCKENSNTKK